jgi:hypothetical protein
VPVTVENLVWMLTALAAVVVMLTRSRLISSSKQAGVSESPPELLGAHTAVGVVALAAWIAWLSGAARPVGVVGIGLLWVEVAIGLMILARWLPSRGRHATGATGDGWAHGPWLSVLGHGGLFLGISFFTWVFVGADRL